ncbi:hypothetical protein BgiBS90_016659 [Biomphalaria glabrata]|nr:hypothetical protein BgiBS90_016659 [Biomphalaria glabrata]
MNSLAYRSAQLPITDVSILLQEQLTEISTGRAWSDILLQEQLTEISTGRAWSDILLQEQLTEISTGSAWSDAMNINKFNETD